jgi:hypothetical protein
MQFARRAELSPELAAAVAGLEQWAVAHIGLLIGLGGGVAAVAVLTLAGQAPGVSATLFAVPLFTVLAVIAPWLSIVVAPDGSSRVRTTYRTLAYLRLSGRGSVYRSPVYDPQPTRQPSDVTLAEETRTDVQEACGCP